MDYLAKLEELEKEEIKIIQGLQDDLNTLDLLLDKIEVDSWIYGGHGECDDRDDY